MESHLPIVATGCVPIRSIRENFGVGFEAWDASVRRADQQGAKRARRTIQAAAKSCLPMPASTLAGWYVFADLAEEAGINGLQYIGIAKTQRRPLGSRIIDRFKDDSCLDIGLDDLAEEEQRKVVEQRLLTALPQSGGNYVDKHIKAANLVRKSTHILIIGSDDNSALIEEVECCLIGSAVEAGAPLVNIKHRRYRGSASMPAGIRIGEILNALTSLQLSKSAVESWRSCL